MFAILGIGLYVWIRFDCIFSLATWISLAYDCSVLLLFLSLFQQEIGEGAMVWYSVNDTVIIYDRIRENRGYKKTLNCGESV